MKQHVMLDLETLATTPRAVILSIGAVAFDYLPGSSLPTLEHGVRIVLDRDEQVRAGRVIDPGTVAWWCKQSHEAQAVMHEKGVPVGQALTELRDYVASCTVGELDVNVWGNGSDFDNVLLRSLYEDFRMQAPWRYHHSRCFRTLKTTFDAEYRSAQALFANQLQHDALADAVYQAQAAQYIMRREYVRRQAA